MAEDRIVLVENMTVAEATELVKTLPAHTPEENRHKFVFTNQNEFIIGRADRGNPRHRDLGDPERDKIAGYVCFICDDTGAIIEVYLNNSCKDFDYPAFELLKEPQICITRIFGPISIDMEDIPKPVLPTINLPSSEVH
jgi:hypothetical protein